MRRVPSRLLFAAFALSLSPLTSGGVLAEPGFRHGAAAHGRAFGGWHGSAPRHGAFHGRGFARSGPAFGSYGHARRFGFHDFRRGGSPFYGHGRVLHASPFYGPYSYGRVFFDHGGYGGYGHHGYGGYGHHGYGRLGYGHHGYGRIGYGHHGYGGRFYGRGGYGHDGYGRRGYPLFLHSTWVWPPQAEPVVALASAPHPALAGIASVADLPVSLGIRSAPAASPAIYVVGSGTGSLRSGGVKVVSAERGGSEGEAAGSGPRIIRLAAPRGR
jgi:hypothetical protein